MTSRRTHAEAALLPGSTATRSCPAAAGVAAVILAAGEGSRLGRPSKPLASVAGVTLLERAVATVRSAGVGRVIVVLGHAKEAVAAFVSQRGLDVELVENDRFSVGNGSSVIAGGQAAGDRFLLMMGDHVVEPDAIRRLIACPAAFAVAVDTRPAFCDAIEATKVRIAGGAVVAVARELEPWDAVDAGLFVCDTAVIETAEHALASGFGTWNAVKRRWIMQGRRLEAVDLSGSFWIDVDTPDDARRAERLIVARAASKPLDGVVSRTFNRPLSQRISLVLVRAGLSPTSVTLATFGVAIAAALAIALGRWSPVALVAGGLLVQLASIVDGCDGEVARATLQTSRFGAFLDSVLDRLADVAVLVALAVASASGATTWAALAAALATGILVPYVKAAYEATVHESFPSRRRSFGRDARLLTVAIGAIALQPLWALVAVAVVSTVESAVRVIEGLRAAAGRR